MSVVQVLEVTKEYRLKRGKKTALNRVSFQIEKGEAVGLIGRNGSGKSSLLKILAGITVADSGTVSVQGRVAALLELGAGFHPEYTGIENIYLNGTLQGKTRAETRAKLPEILDFAQIGEFVHQKVKFYSTGMFLRLAFAAAVAFEPEILLVDEALAVGDLSFQARCFQKLKECKERGATILYVSHDIDSVRRFCSRAIWLEEGMVRANGDVAEVTAAYMAEMVGQGNHADGGRFGTHPGAIRKITAPAFWEYGQEISILAEVCLPEGAERCNLSVSVKTREGLDLLVLSSRERDEFLTGGGIERVEFRFQNPLCGGRYLLSAGLEIPGSHPISYYDYQEAVLEIQTEDTPYFGSFHIPVEVKRNVKN